jgi:hypothetical protein
MTTSQHRAVKNYRERLSQSGLARFEVIALDRDKELIRELAKRLSEGGEAAAGLRSCVSRDVGFKPPKGGIYAALRNSPLVGSDIHLEREFDAGRKVDL